MKYVLKAYRKTGDGWQTRINPHLGRATDMNDNTFGWQWSNAPFASTCAAGLVRNVAARSANNVCQNSCAETAISDPS